MRDLKEESVYYIFDSNQENNNFPELWYFSVMNIIFSDLFSHEKQKKMYDISDLFHQTITHLTTNLTFTTNNE